MNETIEEMAWIAREARHEFAEWYHAKLIELRISKAIASVKPLDWWNEICELEEHCPLAPVEKSKEETD